MFQAPYSMKKGFTLLEITVVIAIIILLSAIFLANYRTGEKQFALRRATHKLAQDLRRTQEMAMSAKEFQDSVPPRYGIEFEVAKDYYILFADMNDNGKRESEPADNIIDTINLEKGISINPFIVDPPNSPSLKDKIWVTFKPPDPLTRIRCPADPEPDGFPIGIIQLTNNGKIKEVRVNKVGLIDID